LQVIFTGITFSSGTKHSYRV